MKLQLANNLKKTLRAKDITAAQLSRATKIPAQTINNWLSGLEPRSMSQVKVVADYFETSIDELAYGSSLNKTQIEPMKQYEEEINAGLFEVVLRRVKK